MEKYVLAMKLNWQPHSRTEMERIIILPKFLPASARHAHADRHLQTNMYDLGKRVD
jgi:hypothetical protein